MSLRRRCDLNLLLQEKQEVVKPLSTLQIYLAEGINFPRLKVVYARDDQE